VAGAGLTKSVALVSLAILILTVGDALASDRQLSPPVPEGGVRASSSNHSGSPEIVSQDTIVAALVKSWGHWDCLVWEDLSRNWSQYGQTAVSIDTTLLNRQSFTSVDLNSTGADMLIISSPCGDWKTFSPEEIEAVGQYALGGHNLLGTYLLFSYTYGGTTIDNRGLAPVFGIDSSSAYSMRAIDRRYHFGQGEYVFEGMESPYRSQGYSLSQVPESGFWSDEDLVGSRVAAATSDDLGIVSFYPAGSYAAFYISSMPEYGGGETDHQFLYNVVTYQGPTGVEEYENPELPDELLFIRNYPNPFNASTVFEYNLPRDSEVTLEILNLLGQKVEVVASGKQSAGFKIVRWNSRHLSSGTYFCRLSAGELVAVKSLVITR
jgi:hypothetical protein